MKNNLKILLFIFIVIIGGFIILILIAEDAVNPNPKYNTEYSKNFKENLFNKKLLGISETNLKELLGEPIKRESLEISEYYLYTNDTSKVDFIEGSSGIKLCGGNENLKYKLITFNEKGILTNIITEKIEFERENFLGIQKNKIIEKFGKPDKEMLCDCDLEVLSYTELKKGSYKGKSPIIELRKVVIGKDKLVKKLISKIGNPYNKYDGTCRMK
jgi:hypothetical protein